MNHSSSETMNREDTGLSRVVDGWERLPEAVRVGILAMVDAAMDRGT